MATKCKACGQDKGRRSCRLEGDTLICSRCCASTRTMSCRGCSHFESAMEFEARKKVDGRSFSAMVMSDDIERSIDMALAGIEKGEYSEADSLLRDLDAQYPDNYLVLYAMGTSRSVQGYPAAGIPLLQRSIELFPYLAEAHYNLGASFKQQVNVAMAVKSMRRALELAGPEATFVDDARNLLDLTARTTWDSYGVNLDTYLDYHDVFNEAVDNMRANRWDQAIAGFERVVAVLRTHVQSLGNLGLCYAKLGAKARALEYLDRALAVDPHYHLATSNKIKIEALEPGETFDDEPVIMDFYRDQMRWADERQ